MWMSIRYFILYNYYMVYQLFQLFSFDLSLQHGHFHYNLRFNFMSDKSNVMTYCLPSLFQTDLGTLLSFNYCLPLTLRDYPRTGESSSVYLAVMTVKSVTQLGSKPDWILYKVLEGVHYAYWQQVITQALWNITVACPSLKHPY